MIRCTWPSRWGRLINIGEKESTGTFTREIECLTLDPVSEICQKLPEIQQIRAWTLFYMTHFRGCFQAPGIFYRDSFIYRWHQEFSNLCPSGDKCLTQFCVVTRCVTQ